MLSLGACLLGLLALVALVRIPVTYNLRNLVVRWRVTALTGLAFTLVVGLLTVMLAFVNGMIRMTEGNGHPGNVVVLSNGVNDELNSTIPFSDAGEVATLPGIVRDEQGRPLCSREVYIGISQPLEREAGARGRRRILQLRGLDDLAIAARVRDAELQPGGSWYSEAGVREVLTPDGGTVQAIEAVMGGELAREWRMGVGDMFECGNRWWVISGVLKPSGSAWGSEIWARRSLIGQTFGNQTAYTTLVLRTPDAESARQFADYLSRDYKKTALSAQPERLYYAKLAKQNQELLTATYLVAVIIAVGGIFGIMNTMFAAISQRTRDIGVLRILGFSRLQVLLSFLMESLLLALFGGVLGCALGSLVHGRTASSWVGDSKSIAFTLTVDANTLVVGILFTLCMGALGGLLPALSAVRIKPLEAVR